MREHPNDCALGLTRETLSAWRDQLLPEVDAQRIALHVPECTTCQYRLAQFARMALAMQRQPAPDLRAQTWQGLQARLFRKEQHPMRSRISAFSSIGIIAILLLLGVLFAVLLSHRPNPNSGPATGTIPPSATTSATTPTPPTPGPVTCQFTHSEPPPANVPLPPGTIIGGGNGASGVVTTQVCTPGGTQSSISAFMNANLPGAGWHVYNPSTDVNGGCPHTFWTWANGHTALYWDFTSAGKVPYWTIWICGRINV